MGKLACSVCDKIVRDGVLEDGKPRHATCGEPRERKIRQCLSLPASAIETFRRLGHGNVSEGGKIAASLADKFAT